MSRMRACNRDFGTGPTPSLHSSAFGLVKRGRTGNLLQFGLTEKKRKGFILPLVVLALTSVAFFLMFVSNMGSSYLSQVAHEDDTFRCRIIAESVITHVLAQIRQTTWKKRFFFPKPYKETNQTLFGGMYSLYVTDAPDRANEVDIYVDSKFGTVHRLFIWRYKFEYSILDNVGRLSEILFTYKSTPNFVPPTAGSPLKDLINGLLVERSNNQNKSDEKSATIKTLSHLGDIAQVLNGPDVVDVVASSSAVAIPVIPADLSPVASSVWTTLIDENFDNYALNKTPPDLQIFVIQRGYPFIIPQTLDLSGSRALGFYSAFRHGYWSFPNKLGDYSELKIECVVQLPPAVFYNSNLFTMGLKKANLINNVYSYGFLWNRFSKPRFKLFANLDLKKMTASVKYSVNGVETNLITNGTIEAFSPDEQIRFFVEPMIFSTHIEEPMIAIDDLKITVR
ncbi:MAG: hypothetical protein HQM08_28740 [Candidatus Riflebacteria bacterium]|nr:hypothetical protein [Candidatus Riflebacteria bacterium]